ncbi:MAG: OadG family protein [Candidatus Margulisbacteria bacterium]|jgi:sodium pump decarboxylase gamma subunit|nr:OadG family protein [Candidatus Margulisiibacteriota bacterium]
MLWVSALQLTIAGMSVVFVFLIVLVYAINLLGLIVPQLFPEPAAVPPPEEAEDTGSLIAAIVTALTSVKH